MVNVTSLTVGEWVIGCWRRKNELKETGVRNKKLLELHS